MIDLNTRIDDNDPCWLVKVDTRILGPMTFNEVLSKLTAGELYSHNEVMAPLDRWRTLQSHPLFAAAVEKLRRQDETSEYTMTRTERTSFTRTLDINFETMTPTPMRDRDTTPPPTPAFIPPPQSPVAPPPPRPLVAPPVFRPQEKKSSTVPLLIGVGALVAAAVVSAVVFTKKKPSTPAQQVDANQSSVVDYFDRGFLHKQRGEWAEAVKNFRYASNINSKDHYTAFELAPLLVQYENQPIIARNILDKVGGVRFNPEDICLSRNAAGLAYSYEGQIDKKNFVKAVQKFDECLNQVSDEAMPTETVAMAKLNKGFALMKLGKYSQAESLLATSKGAQGMAPYLFILENYLYEGHHKNNPKAFEKAYNLSSQIVNRNFFDGYQEIALFNAYAAFKMGQDTSAVAVLLEKALNIEPDLTTDHYHTPAMDWRVFNWKTFDFICKDFKNFPKPDLVMWLDFTCSYKMGNEIEAQQILGGWLGRSVDKSSAPHIAQAILQNRFGEVERAKDSLSSKLVRTPNKLYYQVLTKTCVRLKDESCLETNAPMIAKNSSIHGTLAKANFGSDASREQALKAGLQEWRNYLPFLRAR